MSDIDDEDIPPDARGLRAAEVTPSLRTLAEILEHLPTAPGVYTMKDRRGKILYIGKAANLRTRVRQYFQPNTGDIRRLRALAGAGSCRTSRPR